MMEYRIEKDTMGQMKVPADKYWGAQTQRSLENFRIGKAVMPEEVINAFAVLKMAAARINRGLGLLDDRRAELIVQVCEEILDGKLKDQFPLAVYQTGSGTHSNMNVNEVIAGRGNEIAGEKLLHPNDHVNMSQSSNDTFPTAMHIAALTAVEDRLIPALHKLADIFSRLEDENSSVMKIGRTHLQDATPMTFGQEISGWRSCLEHDIAMIEQASQALRELAIGGTAVGTGINAPEGFGEKAADEISRITGKKFVSAPNKFHALTSKDGITFAHGALKALAADMMKIANDVRWLASGPRCGIGEIYIPANEPGSSIMPGKVNPTQCEAVTMVCVQVMGNDAAIGIAASQGNFQLNVFMPVIIYNFLESAGLLAEAVISFADRCACGIRPNIERLKENMERSLMLVTALTPHIGYDNGAKIAKLAYEKDLTLKQAAVQLGLVSEEDFDRWIEKAKQAPKGI